MNRIVTLWLAAAWFAYPAFPQKLEVDLVREDVVKSRLESGAVPAKQRQAVIRELFDEAGCQIEEQKVHGSDSNIVCTLPGEIPDAVVVGGHYDFDSGGKGIIDDWSGASALPSFYQSLKGRPRKYTYIFVAFAEEERGLVGSAVYAKEWRKARGFPIVAYINLDCIGLGPAVVWQSRSNPGLVLRLDQLAASMNLSVAGVNVEQVGDDDSHSFLPYNIPVLSIHSVTQATFGLLHSSRDRLDAIKFDDYYQTYRLMAFYLAYMDSLPPL